MVDFILPTWPLVMSTALIDSINPCAIGVLVILVATLVELFEDKNKMLKVGIIYITSIFLTYLATGFGLTLFIQRLQIGLQLSMFVGILVVIMGLIEIKDFFWEGKGISLVIPKKHAKTIMKKINNITLPGAIILGMFVAAVELPCTGGPYLAITTILSEVGFSWTVFALLVVYNLIFVLPLIIILTLVYFGFNAEKIKNWKNDKKKWMRLFMGLIMLALGVLLILWSTGVVHFGLSL